MEGEEECQRRAEGRRERSRDWPPISRVEMLLADRRGAGPTNQLRHPLPGPSFFRSTSFVLTFGACMIHLPMHENS